MSLYQQNRHNRSIGWSNWHLQWCTKYRYKIFYNDDYRNLCKIFLHETAKKQCFTIFDCEVDIDHVHVIASLPLTMAPVKALNALKSVCAKGLFREIPHLRRIYRRGKLWSPGKFIGSVAHITLEKAKKYLKAHHAKAFRFINGNPSPETKHRGRPKGEPSRSGRTSNINRRLSVLEYV